MTRWLVVLLLAANLGFMAWMYHRLAREAPPVRGLVAGETGSIKLLSEVESGSAPNVLAPATDAPVADGPATDALGADVPVADTPAVDAPVADAPTADVPVADVPVADGPATDASVADGPVADAPAADVPATDAPAADVLGADVPAADMPAVDASVADAPRSPVPVMRQAEGMRPGSGSTEGGAAAAVAIEPGVESAGATPRDLPDAAVASPPLAPDWAVPARQGEGVSAGTEDASGVVSLGVSGSPAATSSHLAQLAPQPAETVPGSAATPATTAAAPMKEATGPTGTGVAAEVERAPETGGLVDAAGTALAEDVPQQGGATERAAMTAPAAPRDAAPAERPEGAKAAAPDPQAAGSSPNDICLHLGPLTQEASAQRLVAWVEQHGGRASARSELIGRKDAHWMYLGPFEDLTRARVESDRLRELGVMDHLAVRHEQLGPVVSLGLYGTVEGRERRVAALRAVGVEPIVVPRGPRTTRWWVEARLPGGSGVTPAAFATARDEDSGEVSVVDCP